MSGLQDIEGLSECIGRAIQEHLARSNISLAWPQMDGLGHPVLRFEAFLEDASPNGTSRSRSKRVASRTLDLTGMMSPTSSRSPTANFRENEVLFSTAVIGSPDTLSFLEETQDIESVKLDQTSRKGTGGLRILQNQAFQEDPSEHQRQMQVDERSFPKRKKVISEKFVFQPSTLDKLIIGIWEQIHGSIDLDPKAIFEQFQIAPGGSTDIMHRTEAERMTLDLFNTAVGATVTSFSQMNVFCRKVTQASRVCRSIEMIVQARWTELFEDQVQLRSIAIPELSVTKHRKVVFMEACQDFGWSEKELRNKMAIWRGYKEVKDAAGWAALIFAGMGIYRFCKYRVGFDKDAMRRLRNLRKRLEVAADTLHPHWRELLTVVGESRLVQYPGHQHDWVVSEDGSDPVSLQHTYHLHDPYFCFEHIEESIVDNSVWGCEDPRWIPQSTAISRASCAYICALCKENQSDDPKTNSCFCFPSLFGCVKRKPSPVQVYRTSDGKNNGLVTLTSFDRGMAIGEFVGLITKGITHLDVMDSSTPMASYQIWQGRMGNYTRFVNHSCNANAQSSTFLWLDTQRVILVSKGVDAGSEITVDYGDKYWAGLNKACLCGQSCCRYSRNDRR